MKTAVALTFAVALAFVSAVASGEQSATVSLEMPAALPAEACSQPAWTNASAVWKGVVDKRPSAEVGTQTQKGKEPIPVLSDPPAAEAFDRALKKLLPACGMKLVEKVSDDALVLSAELREFYVGVEKKLLTGKSEARSSVAFMARKGNRSTSVTVGYEIDSKRVRSGNIKQISKALSELFAETLRQITATQEMRELK